MPLEEESVSTMTHPMLQAGMQGTLPSAPLTSMKVLRVALVGLWVIRKRMFL